MAFSFKSFVAEELKAIRKENKEFKQLLLLTNQNLEKIMLDLTKLTAEVSEIKTVAQSAVALIKGIAQELKDAKGDQAKIDALAEQLDGGGNELAAAITANTPAAAEPKPGTPA